ncbi:MAG: hypothetical protein FJ191_00845 [Gammaproteobacteria bacterium]|nr:hypothetical protein [Gammaproteobacteria bacterium]
MSSNASPAPDGAPPYRVGFDARLQGRRAECDGGQAIEGTHFAGRQDFAGTLTGEFREFGPYPWRWYLLTALTRKPQGFAYAAVWCDSGSLFIEGEAR